MSDVVEPPLVPIKEAARSLGCCRATVYHMQKRGQIRLVRLRGRTMVPASELKRIAAGEPLQPLLGEPAGEPYFRRPKKVRLSPKTE